MRSVSFIDDRFPVRTLYTDNEDCKDYDDSEPITARSDSLIRYAGIPVKRVVYAREIHSGSVMLAGENEDDDCFLRTEECLITKPSGGYDSVITNVPGVMMCITTADCLPLFIYDPAAGAAAITHCGWRGICSGIASSTVELIRERFGGDPSRTVAAFGPCICGSCYEVGEELKSDFARLFAADEIDRFFTPRDNGKYLLDIRSAVTADLLRIGLKIDNIYDTGICSYESPEYASYRRTGKVIPAKQTISGLVMKQ